MQSKTFQRAMSQLQIITSLDQKEFLRWYQKNNIRDFSFKIQRNIKKYIVVLSIVFVTACTTSFSTLDQAIPQLKGKHVDVAIEHLGMPDKKYTIDNKDVYLWSNIESHVSASTTPTQTYGNIGNTKFSAYTTNFKTQAYDLRCEIKVVTEKKIIKSFEYSGNNGACFRYSDRLKPLLSSDQENQKLPTVE